MLNQQKSISVVVPTYNCGKYICETIESILNQTYEFFEIIVVDDGSTDDTRKVLKPYIEGEKLRYFYQENKGPSAARNRGILKANGEYIAFLDADDLWANNYLEQCIDCLCENSDDLVMTDNYDYVYSKDGALIDKKYSSKKKKVANENRLYEMLFRVFQDGVSGDIRIVIKRVCFDKIGFFDENLRFLEDWDLWLRIAKNNLKIGYIQEPLSIYRRHSNSACRNSKNTRLKLVHIYNAFRKNRKEAFDINKLMIKPYSETLWMIGVESVVKRVGLFFGLKCIFESQLYDFNIIKIEKMVRIFKIFKKNRGHQ